MQQLSQHVVLWTAIPDTDEHRVRTLKTFGEKGKGFGALSHFNPLLKTTENEHYFLKKVLIQMLNNIPQKFALF